MSLPDLAWSEFSLKEKVSHGGQATHAHLNWVRSCRSDSFFTGVAKGMGSTDALTKAIMMGLPKTEQRSALEEQTKDAIDNIFGERYHKNSPQSKRVRIQGSDEKVQFAGLVHQESPDSGVYGGTSLIWFPVTEDNDKLR